MSDTDHINPETPFKNSQGGKRTIDDYAVTITDRVPHLPGSPWPALNWSMWERAGSYLLQCETYHESPRTSRAPDLKLLEAHQGEWGSVERVSIEQDERDGRDIVGLHFLNPRHGFPYRPRLFDIECVLLPLMLILPGGSLGFNPDGGERTHLYHGAYGDKTPLRRILADTPPGYREADPILDDAHPYGFYSYLIRDWAEPREAGTDGLPTKKIYRGRWDGYDISLTCFDKRASELQSRIHASEHLTRLRRASRVADTVWDLCGRPRDVLGVRAIPPKPIETH